MTRALWNGAVIAQSDATIVVEGNHYFPPADVDPAYLRPSGTHTECSWKGTASYHDVARGRRREQGCRLVLSGPQARRRQHRRLHRLLARCAGGALSAAVPAAGPQSAPRANLVTIAFAPRG